MKTYPKLFILVLLAITACCMDNDPEPLNHNEILLKYDWILFNVLLNPSPGHEPEPDVEYTVWSFTEADFSGSDFTGTFYNRGEWNLTEDDILTLDGYEVEVIKLNRKALIYRMENGTIVKRLPVSKIDR